jgi:hypothetical protein
MLLALISYVDWRYDNIPGDCVISRGLGIYVWWRNLASCFKQVNNLRGKMKLHGWVYCQVNPRRSTSNRMMMTGFPGFVTLVSLPAPQTLEMVQSIHYK